MSIHLFKYLVHLADNTLILGQRNSEWTGHGPVLEQDIAITNISLDLLGQARNFYQYASFIYNNFDQDQKEAVKDAIPAPWWSYNRELTEDDLAFLRDERQYLNLLIAELPKGDWAFTILRQFFFSVFQLYQYQVLVKSSNQHLSSIAEKSYKEVMYHVRWSGEWVIRLGDGTTESNRRIKKSIADLWPYTGEIFMPSEYEMMVLKEGQGVELKEVEPDWTNKIKSVFEEAGLELPAKTWMQQGGKAGSHTEHFGYLLADMQYLQRAFPNVTW